VSHFLLEKARVVAREAGESSYHVFYYLLQGAPEWIRGGLAMADEKAYNYLQPGGNGAPLPTKEQHNKKPGGVSADAAARRCSKYEFAGAAKVRKTCAASALAHHFHRHHRHHNNNNKNNHNRRNRRHHQPPPLQSLCLCTQSRSRTDSLASALTFSFP
jgi:hypothetical protein